MKINCNRVLILSKCESIPRELDDWKKNRKYKRQLIDHITKVSSLKQLIEKSAFFQADGTLQTLPGGSRRTWMTLGTLRAEVSDQVQTGSVCVAPVQNLNLSHTRLTLGPDFTQTGGKMCKINMSIAAQEVPSLRKHIVIFLRRCWNWWVLIIWVKVKAMILSLLKSLIQDFPLQCQKTFF